MSVGIESRSSASVTPYTIVLDSETTALDATIHRVAEIAFRVLNLSTGNFICSYNSVAKLSDKEWKEAQPKALEVNGITWEKISSLNRVRALLITLTIGMICMRL